MMTRGSQDHLDLAVAAHILSAHEEPSALRAVDKARLQCTNAACEIGRKNHQNLSIGKAELALTDYDKALLAGMRIAQE